MSKKIHVSKGKLFSISENCYSTVALQWSNLLHIIFPHTTVLTFLFLNVSSYLCESCKRPQNPCTTSLFVILGKVKKADQYNKFWTYYTY